MSYVDNPFESPAIISFCPGILGLERGLVRAIGPIRTIAYVEIEAFAVENILAGIEAGILAPAPIWTNLKTFDARPFRGKIHGIIGGYPCQPFSTAGTRKGIDDPRHLWPHICRHIDAIRPVWCFFENVGGHLTMGFDQVYKDLSRMGYAVEAGIFTAEEVGAPHQRERLFILAVLDVAQSGIGSIYWRQSQYSNQELADASDIGTESRGEKLAGEHLGRDTNNGGQQLADPDSDGPRTVSGDIGCPRETNEGEAQRQERDELQRQRGGGYAGDNGAAVGNTDSQRFEDIGRKLGRSEGRSECEGIWDTIADAGNEWPSGPGQSQQTWESPRLISRTVESSLGISVDGYSFREDLLRALGNSVVEETAELALRILLKKHFS